MLANSAEVGSMFDTTTLSGSVVYGSQRSWCSFVIWFGNFAVQDSMYYPRSLELKLIVRKVLRIEGVPTAAQPIDKLTPQKGASNGFYDSD